MKKIKLNKTIMFGKARTEGYQRCSYCREFIGKDKIGLSIRKGCLRNDINVWIHLKCIKLFGEAITQFYYKNRVQLLMEQDIYDKQAVIRRLK